MGYLEVLHAPTKEGATADHTRYRAQGSGFSPPPLLSLGWEALTSHGPQRPSLPLISQSIAVSSEFVCSPVLPLGRPSSDAFAIVLRPIEARCPARAPARSAGTGKKERAGRTDHSHHQQWPECRTGRDHAITAGRHGAGTAPTAHQSRPAPGHPTPVGHHQQRRSPSALHARACALALGAAEGEGDPPARRRTRRSPCRAPGRQRGAADVDRG